MSMHDGNLFESPASASLVMRRWWRLVIQLVACTVLGLGIFTWYEWHALGLLEYEQHMMSHEARVLPMHGHIDVAGADEVLKKCADKAALYLDHPGVPLAELKKIQQVLKSGERIQSLKIDHHHLALTCSLSDVSRIKTVMQELYAIKEYRDICLLSYDVKDAMVTVHLHADRIRKH